MPVKLRKSLKALKPKVNFNKKINKYGKEEKNKKNSNSN